jgi:DNA-binding transcriptional LysR family regulator
MVGFRSTRTGTVLPLEFKVGRKVEEILLPTSVTVASGETMVAAARQGLGLIQVPRYHVESLLAEGALVEVLEECSPTSSPVSLIYPQSRQLSPRVRVFLDWVIERFRT